jgi:hypothetical protein
MRGAEATGGFACLPAGGRSHAGLFIAVQVRDEVPGEGMLSGWATCTHGRIARDHEKA